MTHAEKFKLLELSAEAREKSERISEQLHWQLRQKISFSEGNSGNSPVEAFKQLVQDGSMG